MSITRRTFIKAFAVLTAWLAGIREAKAHHKPGHTQGPKPEPPANRSGLLLGLGG